MEPKTNQTRTLKVELKSLWISMICLSSMTLTAAPSQRSEIVFTDSQAAILRTDTLSGGPTVISSGSKLMQPFGIAVAKNGELLVSDTGCLGLFTVNQVSGEQRLISSGPALGIPFGISVERDGMILVANSRALLRVDPATGVAKVLSYPGLFKVPVGVAVSENGDIFVVDALGSVVCVDPVSGTQTPISSGGYLKRPQGIAVKGNKVYVTDVATSDMNFGVGRIISIDMHSHQQSVVAEGGYLVGPVGIAVESNGDLLIGDPYTINPSSADLFDGGIIRVDKNTGQQKLLARGSESFVNPRGVALVSATN